MDLAGVVLRLFGVATQLQERARGFALLLALPVIIVGIADWRIRRPR
jgi:type III secretory pathway component EscS